MHVFDLPSIRQLASEHGYCLEQILTSSTLTRHVNAFASDLEILDPAGKFSALSLFAHSRVYPLTVWESIKPVVLEEIRIRMPNANGRTPCPFCISNGRPRLFSSHALRQHFESRLVSLRVCFGRWFTDYPPAMANIWPNRLSSLTSAAPCVHAPIANTIRQLWIVISRTTHM